MGGGAGGDKGGGACRGLATTCLSVSLAIRDDICNDTAFCAFSVHSK